MEAVAREESKVGAQMSSSERSIPVGIPMIAVDMAIQGCALGKKREEVT